MYCFDGTLIVALPDLHVTHQDKNRPVPADGGDQDGDEQVESNKSNWFPSVDVDKDITTLAGASEALSAADTISGSGSGVKLWQAAKQISVHLFLLIIRVRVFLQIMLRQLITG